MPGFVSTPLPGCTAPTIARQHAQRSVTCSARGQHHALKKILSASVAVGFVSLGLPYLSSSATEEMTVVKGYPRVVDGDTFAFSPAGGVDEKKSQRVRLLAMDAFETRQLCVSKEGAEYRCGEESKQAMVNIIGGGEVMCQGKNNDPFGRLVGTCFNARGKDVGEELVREGWALAFPRYGKQYVTVQHEAELKGAGVWAGTFTEPWQFRKQMRQ